MTTPIITAIGAVTSVGLDAITTCASIRAGLSRPDTLMERGLVSVTGHPIPVVTRGLTGVDRWLPMAALALEDLSRAAQLPRPDDTLFWSTTMCYVVIPVLDRQRFLMEPACASKNTVTREFLKPLETRVAPWFSLARSVVWPRGRVGVLEVIQLAVEHFRHRRCERVVVLAVDSLTDGTGLAWLDGQGRLRHDDHPVGLCPGEGAAALMLEAPGAAAARGAVSLGYVGAVSSDGEPDPSHGHPPGEGLARVIERLLHHSEIALPYTAETITDLNGEPWRAKEYGHARVRVPRHTWDGDAVERPVACVGDVGAAMTALQCVLACRALHRSYATSDHILLTTHDEYGHVGAAMLKKGWPHQHSPGLA